MGLALLALGLMLAQATSSGSPLLAPIGAENPRWTRPVFQLSIPAALQRQNRQALTSERDDHGPAQCDTCPPMRRKD